MSKIIINEIEPKTTNGDLSITPNGTGAFEITAENSDGVLQLNDEQNSNNVKIKASPLSAAQDHTLVLPDNQISTNSYLKVKSVTGSGATAAGQLEYASIAQADLSQLNANNLTSGTVPSARMPSSFPASSGFGLQLVSTTTVSSMVKNIYVTGLQADQNYLMIGKKMYMIYDHNGNPYNSYMSMRWLDSSNGLLGPLTMERHYENAGQYYTYHIDSYSHAHTFDLSGGDRSPYFSFWAEFDTNQGSSMYFKASYPWYGAKSRIQAYMSFTNSNRISGIQMYPNSGSIEWGPGTEVKLYKYITA